MNICMCGVEAGYPHLRECPYPYYGVSEDMQDKWVADMQVLRQAQAELDTAVAHNRAAQHYMQATGLRPSGADEQTLSSDSSGDAGSTNPPRA